MEHRTLLAAGAQLEHWAAHGWVNGIHVESLDAMASLRVYTQNSTYEIVLISPWSREILLRGGRFFSEFTPARLAGSSLGGSFLKMGGIYVGFKMEINSGGRV